MRHTQLNHGYYPWNRHVSVWRIEIRKATVRVGCQEFDRWALFRAFSMVANGGFEPSRIDSTERIVRRLVPARAGVLVQRWITRSAQPQAGEWERVTFIKWKNLDRAIKEIDPYWRAARKRRRRK